MIPFCCELHKLRLEGGDVLIMQSTAGLSTNVFAVTFTGKRTDRQIKLERFLNPSVNLPQNGMTSQYDRRTTTNSSLSAKSCGEVKHKLASSKEEKINREVSVLITQTFLFPCLSASLRTFKGSSGVFVSSGFRMKGIMSLLARLRLPPLQRVPLVFLM